jgi:hypothetical protein
MLVLWSKEGAEIEIGPLHGPRSCFAPATTVPMHWMPFALLRAVIHGIPARREANFWEATLCESN